jgi:predicted transcriptional regulator
MPHKNDSTSFRLSDVARRLLQQLADRHGISKRSVLEMLIRAEAERAGLVVYRESGAETERSNEAGQ